MHTGAGDRSHSESHCVLEVVSNPLVLHGVMSEVSTLQLHLAEQRLFTVFVFSAPALDEAGHRCRLRTPNIAVSVGGRNDPSSWTSDHLRDVDMDHLKGILCSDFLWLLMC